jgi:hypothetical protein
MLEATLTRWAMREGKTVKWGNWVMGYRGQEYCETFATEADAIERERQAKACEDISANRDPIAIERIQLH